MATTQRLLTRERLDPEAPHPIDMAKLVSELWLDSEQTQARRFTLQREELRYSLSLRHYKFDRGNPLDQRAVQPHGPELFNLIRHDWSEICKVPTYLETRPQLPEQDDPQLSDDAKIALESVIYNPLKLYKKQRRRMVMGALAARSWVMAVDAVPGLGPYGSEICFRLVEPWRFHIAPGWQDMHDPTCPWVGEIATMRLGDVLARKKHGWKVDGVRPDNYRAPETSSSNGVPLGDSNIFNKQGVASDVADPSQTAAVTIAKWWFRFDGATTPVRTPIALKPQEQFGECDACGYQTMEVPREADGSVQDYMLETGPDGMPRPLMCPACQQRPLLPVREAEQIDVFASFPDGRLVIVAIASKKVLYDGPWPQKLRSFPYMMFRCYDHPTDVVGQSETSLHWTSQMILNGLRRFSWEQMRRNVDLIIVPGHDTLQNQHRQPWNFNDLHGQVAYAKNAQMAAGIQHFQGSGIPSGLPAVYSMFQEQFRGGQGTTDFGASLGELKNTPVGTIERYTEVGALPNADKIEMLQEEESIFLGIVLDMVVQTWGEERAARYLGPDGRWRVKALKGALLTSMDVMVTASPTLAVVKSDELASFREWADLMAVNPAGGMVAAKLANIPMGLVREYLAALKEQPLPGPAGPGAPPPGPGGPPPAGAGNPAGGAMTGAMAHA